MSAKKLSGELPSSDFLDIRQAAAYLNQSVRWMYRRREEGTIPVHKMGGRLMYKKSDLDAYARMTREEAAW